MSLPSPQELFDTRPDVRENFLGFGPYTFGGSQAVQRDLAKVAGIAAAQPGNVVDYLETWQDLEPSRYDPRLPLKLVSLIPPATMHQAYGEEALVWARVHNELEGSTLEIDAELIKTFGYDTSQLEQARAWAVNFTDLSRLRTRDVIRQYETMQAMNAASLQNVDLEQILHDNALPDITLSPKRIADYSLLPLRLPASRPYPAGREATWSGLMGDLIYDVYLDTPSGIALAHKGRPQAVIGAAATSLTNVEVSQIQGVRPYKTCRNEGGGISPAPNKDRVAARGLAPLDWHGVLLDTVQVLAQEIDMESMSVRTGRKTPWAGKTYDGMLHLSYEAAKKNYDDVAVANGFVQGLDKNWHRPIAT